MYATNDQAIDPAQPWDWARKHGTERENQCPIYLRLSGWAGTPDARYVLHRPTERNDERPDGLLTLHEYSEKTNRNIAILLGLRHLIAPAFKNHNHILYSRKDLDDICEKEWPGPELVSLNDAISICKRYCNLPKMVRKIGAAQFYNRAETEAKYEEILAQRKKDRQAKHDESQRLRAERAELDAKNPMGVVRQVKARVPVAPAVIPDGYMRIREASEKYNLHNGALASTASRGKIKSIMIKHVLYLLETDVIAYRDKRKKRKVEIPVGYIKSSEAAKRLGMKVASFANVRNRNRFHSISCANNSWVDWQGALTWYRNTHKISGRQLELLEGV